MLKRISIILFLIILFFIPYKINGYEINREWDFNDLNPEDLEFNYLIFNNNMDNEMLYYLRYFPKENKIGNGYVKYEYKLINSKEVKTLYINYYIENGYGSKLEAYIDDDLAYDLRFENNVNLYKASSFYFETKYKMEFEDYSSNLQLALDFIDKLNYSFIKFVNINENEVNINTPSFHPYNKYLIEDYLKENYKDIYLAYDDYFVNNSKIKAGNYKIVYMVIDDDNNLILYKYNINVEEGLEYFYCDDIITDFDNYLNKEKIYDGFVGYYDKSNIESYEIESEYFNTPTKIGKYLYTVKLITKDEEEIIYKDNCYIKVVDESIPYFEINDIGKGDGEYKSVNEIFKNIKAYDSKEGDLTNKIKIKDLDDYENNYDKEGTYRFLLSVRDSYGNKTEELIEYNIEIKEKENPIIEDEEKEDIDDITKIEYEFYVDRNKKLDLEEFRQKLIFSGFYKIDDNLNISGDYFDNNESLESNIVSVELNNEIKYFKITLTDIKADTTRSIKLEDETDVMPIIIGVIIGGCLIALVIYVITIFVKKRKNI